jgi:ubiquinone biosynthesis monooxygenase Coq7
MLNKSLAEIIRVNHAGEMGAKVIYQGQITAFRLKNQLPQVKLTKEMLKQEEQHFDYFNQQMIVKQIRPTIMQPIWKVGGFALGFATAFISAKAAMACTVAVEEVIDKHYQQQLNYLQSSSNNSELTKKIFQFQQEELEHRDLAYNNQAKQFLAFKPLYKFISATTKIAIAISKKI